MGDLDIGIAGCGIAGLAAALFLARAGHSVSLYERFGQPRPLGSGLMIQPTGMAVLDALGLAERVVARGARIGQLFGMNEHGETVLDARYADMRVEGVFGLGIHRASLFGVLFEAVIEAGITLHTGREVAASKMSGAGRTFVFSNGEQSDTHALLVDALGLATPLLPLSGSDLPYGALWTSLPWPGGGSFRPDQLEQRYVRAHRMIGVLPTGTRQGAAELALFWSLRADAFEDWQHRGLAAWKDDVLAMWPQCDVLLDLIESPEQLTFARYAHRETDTPAEERLIHIGDAWHSASPQLGQGANMALLDAYALAAALGHDEPIVQRLAKAVALRRSHVRLYQRLTALFTPLYQSNAAWPVVVRDGLLAPLGRMGPGPRIQGLLVGGLAGNPLGRLGLTMPDYPALAA
ncbi:MAG: NAD(P)/FAD-dependent oxidoreductase [Croceibacterium sp.]